MAKGGCCLHLFEVAAVQPHSRKYSVYLLLFIGSHDFKVDRFVYPCLQGIGPATGSARDPK